MFWSSARSPTSAWTGSRPTWAYRSGAGLLIAGIVLNGVASGAYIGAGLGPGPRDGLMTGIVARTGWPVKWVRTAIELTVIAVGWLLGGSVGVGTLLYALTIGPLVHVFLPLFTVPPEDGRLSR